MVNAQKAKAKPIGTTQVKMNAMGKMKTYEVNTYYTAGDYAVTETTLNVDLPYTITHVPTSRLVGHSRTLANAKLFADAISQLPNSAKYNGTGWTSPLKDESDPIRQCIAKYGDVAVRALRKHMGLVALEDAR